MTVIQYNPYESVDWEKTTQLSTDIHIHAWKVEEEAHEVIDHVCSHYAPTPEDNERTGYDVYGYSSSGATGKRLFWPWDDVDESMVHDSDDPPENRDPEDLDVVSIPVREIIGGDVDHIHDLFGREDEVPPEGWDGTNMGRQEAIEWIIEGGGMAMLAHPQTYESARDREIEDYTEFEEHDPDDLIGTEVFSTKGHFTHIWDGLNELYAAERGRPVFGFGASDLQETLEVGVEGMRWETVLLVDPDKIDPSDQDPGREEVETAYREGRTLSTKRASWDDDAEDSPQLPIIKSIDVGGDTISIDADYADTIEWRNHTGLVGTGETIEVESYHSPFIRAKLTTGNPEGETYTQPWLVGEDDGDEEAGDSGELTLDEIIDAKGRLDALDRNIVEIRTLRSGDDYILWES